MKYLLSISIGPVQDFIAAARRTADLYAGSQLLQEICQEVAQALDKQGAKLIFPSNANADGANKILAEVEGDPRGLAEECKKAAQEKLLKTWDDALSKLPPAQREHIEEERAKEQFGHFLEFYAAWVPLGDDYPNARKTVERLLAGRKALREFSPTQQGDDGVPKSPLDPSRASVIDPRQWGNVSIRLEDSTYRPLRIKSTEYLDAVSLLKRCYGAWKSGKVVDTRTMARRANKPDAMPDERYGEDDDHIQEPQPYFAILVADGDKMGDLINQQDNSESHCRLSARLDDFAKEAQKLVENHHGFMVYSGGDDVLAFLPVDKAVACAKALAEKFKREVGRTLSIGIAIVHYREPLSISLEAAREAEKAAKNKSAPKEAQGNRLAVALHTRGGVPVTVVRGWADLTDPKLDWDKLIEAYRDKKVSRGLAYELRNLAREWLDDMGKGYLRKEAERILERKEGRELELPPFENKAELEEFAKQLIIARFLTGLPSPKEEQNA